MKTEKDIIKISDEKDSADGAVTEEILVMLEETNSIVSADEVIDKDEIKQLSKRLKQSKINKDTSTLDDESLVINSEDLEVFQSQMLSRREKTLLMKHYMRNKFVFDLMKVALCALLVTITFDYFISITGKTGLYPAGVGAFARFFSILTSDSIKMQSSFYFVYYFAINIPLIVFGFMKLGKKFTLLTVLYIGLQIAFDQIIQNIPYINPTDFNFIVNYQLLNGNGVSWNNAHWLFIFALIAGLMLGFSYSIVYRLGSSTGGLDFVSVYLSRKFKKPVGGLNKNINLCILFVVILLNTSVMPIAAINGDIKIDIILNGSQDWSNSPKLLENIVRTYVTTDPNILVTENGVMLNDLLSSFIPTGEELYKNVDQVVFAVLESFKTSNYSLGIDIKDNVFKEMVIGACLNGYDGTGLSTGAMVGIKARFIVGPSLFASLVLILSSGFATNMSYPKFKISTYVINTTQSKEINTKLFKLGYQNDVLHWNGINHINGNYIHTDMLMITMPVMEWTPIERELFLIDPEMRINIISTTAVKGMFNYEVHKNEDRDVIIKNLHDNSTEVEKIKQIATVRYKKMQRAKLKSKRK
ncbi:YitT family ABC transporter [Spiroplasma endosymbiont of Othius punctulatus]|uniref:YitT family ABC transporter n=1 Tax=Spiroplasma endosymbiont of Othius punctulatus TaxID=3066289 RepID=UPI0030CC83D0